MLIPDATVLTAATLRTKHGMAGRRRVMRIEPWRVAWLRCALRASGAMVSAS